MLSGDPYSCVTVWKGVQAKVTVIRFHPVEEVLFLSLVWKIYKLHLCYLLLIIQGVFAYGTEAGRLGKTIFDLVFNHVWQLFWLFCRYLQYPGPSTFERFDRT